MRILIAEDDPKMCKILKLYLCREGFEVDCVGNGEGVLEYFETKQADLLLLDWMMPRKDGITTLREIRKMKIPVKVIMLTARTTGENEFQGLMTGADDYVRKPFDIPVLLLRIRKLCHMESELRYGELCLNPDTREVRVKGERVELTRKEFELLHYFLSNRNMVLTRDRILDAVWGIDYEGEERTVDTHIRRLRKKIGDHYIKTSFGMGYLMGERDE